MIPSSVDEVVKSLPEKPGVYKYYNEDGELLYIGKAKNLKKRVLSYFGSKHNTTARISLMVSKIRNIEFTVVNSEFDALLLENSLIKKHQPKYNVNLKDGKTYPWITIKNEAFPRIFPIRNKVADGSEYYGPYSSIQRMRVILDVIKKLFPLRSCSLVLSEQNIEAQRFKVCLEYQIGLCKGPCEGLQSKIDYDENIQQIRQILKGNSGLVINYLNEKLDLFISNLAFEEAAVIKNKLDLLENFSVKSTVVNPRIHNVDVFSIYTYNLYVFVNYLKVINGTIIQTHTVEFKNKLGESEEDLLLYAIADIRTKYNSTSKEIIVPFEISFEDVDLVFNAPKIGEKKKLLELSTKNAMAYAQQKMKALETKNPQKRTEELLARMKSDLNLKFLPKHIECFDNSNFQGSFPVSSCVVFKDGKPSKQDYRKFNVKTVDQIDDFATMQEVVNRRYSRLVAENGEIPNLIVIDGGKGQLGMAREALEKLGILDRVDLIGIAKRLEEIYRPGDPLPLYVDKTSDSLKVIQQIRNEAHRFAITHHRARREKSNYKTSLDEIAGIGPETAKQLLTAFKSVKKVKLATQQELETLIGKSKARKILDFFKKEKPGESQAS